MTGSAPSWPGPPWMSTELRRRRLRRPRGLEQRRGPRAARCLRPGCAGLLRARRASAGAGPGQPRPARHRACWSWPPTTTSCCGPPAWSSWMPRATSNLSSHHHVPCTCWLSSSCSVPAARPGRPTDPYRRSTLLELRTSGGGLECLHMGAGLHDIDSLAPSYILTLMTKRLVEIDDAVLAAAP